MRCDRSATSSSPAGRISSVAENALMSHPAVLEAAVFAERHANGTSDPSRPS